MLCLGVFDDAFLYGFVLVGSFLFVTRGCVWIIPASSCKHFDSKTLLCIMIGADNVSIRLVLFPESVWAQGSSNSGGLYLIFSSSHLLIFTPSHLHLLIFTPSHLHIFSHTFSSSHLLIFTSSHLHIFSHLLIFTSSLTPSHLHICSSSHLLIFTSSHLHTFSSSHLLLFTSAPLHTFSHTFSSSHLLIFTPSLTPSHLHIFSLSHSLSSFLSPFSLSFLSPFSLSPSYLSLFRPRVVPAGSHETWTLSHEMRVDRRKLR